MASSDRYHNAAKDGLLEVLKEATRKDANSKDDDSMTPVLWAAFEGRLDALRLLCGRGGDPDKCDQFGNTALHLAAAKGHLHCVDFLIKFGVNIYALDIDRHSAKDLAAINNREDILRYLDTATASFEASERKKAKALKELAEKNCEKRMREYAKRQQKSETAYAGPVGDLKATGKSTKMLSTLKQKIWSSQGNLHKQPKEPIYGSGMAMGTGTGSSTTSSAKFSELVGSGSGSSAGSVASRRAGGAVCQGLRKSKFPASRKGGGNGSGSGNGGGGNDSAFKICEIEPDGKRTVTSLTGVQRDSEVLYVGTFSSSDENGKRGKISDVFEVDNEPGTLQRDRARSKLGYGTLSKSFSQPDLLADPEAGFDEDDVASEEDEDEEVRQVAAMQRPAALFDRPMLGSIAFRRSVTAALSQLHNENRDSAAEPPNRTAANVGASKQRKSRSFFNISDSDSEGGGDGYSDDEHDESAGTPIQRFLAVWGLDEYLPIFQKQQIDLDSLLLLTEADLKSLGLPLGPFRKLTVAIQERQNALAHPGPMRDSRL